MIRAHGELILMTSLITCFRVAYGFPLAPQQGGHCCSINQMTPTKSILFLAIFSNINCFWQRDTLLTPDFHDLIMLDMILPQYPVLDITEKKSEKKENEEKQEDYRVRLLRKRDFRPKATMGNIRIL